MTRVVRGGARTPLSGLFQPDPGLADPVNLEAFPVDGDVMVVPAEADQVGGVGSPSVGPGGGVVDFEPVSGGTSFHGASSVPRQHMTTELPAGGPRSASEVQWLTVLCDAEHFDDAVAEDLFECPAAESGSGQHRHSRLATVNRSGASIDSDRHLNRW